MGDISEIRTLIVVVSFLGVFTILATLMPAGFYATSYEGREVNVPENFEAIDLQSFAETHNFTVTFGGGNFFSTAFDLGGWNIRFDAWKPSAFVPEAIMKTYHYAKFWIFEWDFHTFSWYDTSGVNYGEEFMFTELDSIWVAQENGEENATVKMIVKSDQTQSPVFFGWNGTEYSKPSDALNDDAMIVLYCIGMDQVNTSTNAWNLIGMLLFFQMPNIHWAINAIIAIPIWIAIAYVSYILILRTIGAIFGGGA